MTKNLYRAMIFAGVFAIGHFFITGETMLETHGWGVLLIFLVLGIICTLSQKVDNLENRIKTLEYKPLPDDPRFDGLGENYDG